MFELRLYLPIRDKMNEQLLRLHKSVPNFLPEDLVGICITSGDLGGGKNNTWLYQNFIGHVRPSVVI